MDFFHLKQILQNRFENQVIVSWFHAIQKFVLLELSSRRKVSFLFTRIFSFTWFNQSKTTKKSDQPSQNVLSVTYISVMFKYSYFPIHRKVMFSCSPCWNSQTKPKRRTFQVGAVEIFFNNVFEFRHIHNDLNATEVFNCAISQCCYIHLFKTFCLTVIDQTDTGTVSHYLVDRNN